MSWVEGFSGLDAVRGAQHAGLTGVAGEAHPEAVRDDGAAELRELGHPVLEAGLEALETCLDLGLLRVLPEFLEADPCLYPGPVHGFTLAGPYSLDAHALLPARCLGQCPVLELALGIEFATTCLQQFGELVRVGECLLHLGDAHARRSQDPQQGRVLELAGAVGAIAIEIVDVGRGQEADVVVVAQCLDVQACPVGELSDADHARPLVCCVVLVDVSTVASPVAGGSSGSCPTLGPGRAPGTNSKIKKVLILVWWDDGSMEFRPACAGGSRRFARCWPQRWPMIPWFGGTSRPRVQLWRLSPIVRWLVPSRRRRARRG